MKKLCILFTFALIAGTSAAQQDNELVVTEQIVNNKSEIVFATSDDRSDKEYQSLFEDAAREFKFIERIDRDKTEQTVHVYCNSNVSLAQIALLMRGMDITKYTYHPNVTGDETSSTN